MPAFPPRSHRRPTASRRPSLLRPSRLAVWQLDDRIVPAGTVTGTVFRDFNANGVFDSAPRSLPNEGSGSIGTTEEVPFTGGGLVVRAFDAANQLRGEATSTPTGQYTLTLGGTGPYRVEWSNLPAGWSFGPAGDTNTAVGGRGTGVQFVPEGGATGADLGLVRPDDLTADNPQLASSVFVFGANDAPFDPSVPAGQPQNPDRAVVRAFPYTSGRTNTDPVVGDGDASLPEYADPQTHALAIPHRQVGAVWGLAYDRTDRQVLMSAFTKRHSGYGPNGPGAIYTAPAPAGNQTVTTASLLIDLNRATDLAGATLPAGTNFRPANNDFLLDGLANNVGWNAVGNTGLGGLDVSPDGRFAFTVGLANRRLYVIDLSTNAVRSYALPTPTLRGASQAGDVRPFAVTFHAGQVYVGAVNTAESVYAGVPTNEIPAVVPELQAFVFRFDPGAEPVTGTTGRFVDNSGATVSSPASASVFTIDLGYERGWTHPGRNRGIETDDLSANWRPWSATYRNVNPELTTSTREAVYPQPWFTGISFDAAGNMLVGLRDRAGDQFGAFTPSDPSRPPNTGDSSDDPAAPDVTYVTYTVGITAGDLLRATTTTGTSWTLESNGTAGGVTSQQGPNNQQGPGGGEFYTGEYLVPSPGPQQEHQELSAGGVLQLPGFPDVASTAFDPAQVAFRFDAGGVRWYRNAGPAAGTLNKAYELYAFRIQPPTPPPLFAKANGVGDLVALNDTSLEIGNRVWRDLNANGLQDADEPGIGGLTVVLFSGTTALGTTTTAADGSYLFTNAPLPTTPTAGRAYGVGLRTGGSYQVRIPLAQAPLAGLQLTSFQAPLPAGASGLIQLDQVQSDGQAVGGDAVIDVAALGLVGANHTYDAGFRLVPTLNLGDFVWNDADNDGLFDPTETGLPNVTVELVRPDGTTATTLTNAAGGYLFTGLLPGVYRVRIPAGQSALSGFISSSGTPGSPTGTYEPAAGDPLNGGNNTDHGARRGDFYVGPPVTLTLGAAPTGETAVAPGGLDLSDGGVADVDSDRTQDFGFYQPLSLGDTVWVDSNNDGRRQDTEAALPNVTVQLVDAAGTAVAETTTNLNGGYLFRYLAPGTYSVRLVRNERLRGFASSTGNGTEPSALNPPTNDRDAGTQSAGFITSPQVTLAVGGAVLADSLTQPAGLPTDPAPAGSRFRNVDFGLFPLISLGDTVFFDVDNSGVRDPGEAPVADVPVELLGDAGQVIATTRTDADGLYLFPDLFPGRYQVRITAPAGYRSSTGRAGSSTGPVEPGNGAFIPGPLVNDRDNGVVADSGGGIRTAIFDVTATNLSFDFGLFQPLSLGDTVWADANNDGRRQGSEAPLAGVTVVLEQVFRSSVGVAVQEVSRTTTNAAGGYLFTNLVPGTFIVRLVSDAALAGYRSSSGGNTEPSDFRPPQNDVDAGTLVGESIRSPEVTLALGGATLADALTQPAGLPADPAEPANRFRNVDFGLFAPLSLGDLVWEDANNNGLRDAGEPGLAGVVVNLIPLDGQYPVPLTATTGADGGYLFPFLLPGRYQVSIVLESNLPVPPNPVLAGYRSSTGTGLTGPFDAGPYEPAPATAGNNQDHGSYPARDPLLANEVLEVRGPVVNLQVGTAPLNEAADGPTLADPATDANSDRTQDFGFFLVPVVPPPPPLPLSVGNLVWRDLDTDGRFDAGEPGIGGVTVRLRDASGTVLATTTTDGSGRYSFTNLQPGTYTVQIVPPAGLVNSTAAPDAQPADDQNRGLGQPDGTLSTAAFTLEAFGGAGNPDLGGSANLRQDFGLTVPPVVPPPPPPAPVSSLGGTVYLDNDLSGTRQPTEPGLPDVRVLLDGVTTGGERVSREQFTDAAGRYLFTGLPAGSYVVREQSPTGKLFNGLTTVGSVGGTAGVDITTGINLPPNTAATDYDFGEFQPASLFGYVWLDADSDAVREAGELPLPGVPVTVSGTAFAGTRFARPLTAADVPGGLTVLTGGNGRYDFPSLPPGSYTLTETQPDFLNSGEQNGDPYGPPPTIALNQFGGVTLTATAIRGPFNFGEREGGVAGTPGRSPLTPVNPTKREFLSSTGAAGTRSAILAADTGSDQDLQTTAPVARLNLFPAADPKNRSGSISVLATAAGPGAAPVVRVFDTAAGVERFRFLAYEQNFTGGVVTAVGDVDADGVPDIITAVSAGGGPRVRVFSGADHTVLQDFFAYESTFTGGLNLAVGDVDADGRADIITGTNLGGGPRVRVFSGRTGGVVQDFFAFDGSQRGGVRVAAADFTRDGRADVVATTGAGVPTRVRVFDALTQAATIDFAPFEAGFTGGATVAAGDFNADGVPDIFVGADVGGGPRVSVFSGANQTSLVSFFAFEPTFTGGVRVAAVDADGNGTADLVAGAGLGGGGRVTVYSGPGLGVLQDFFATDADQPNGVFVGAGATARRVRPGAGTPVAAGSPNRVGALAELPADFGTAVSTL